MPKSSTLSVSSSPVAIEVVGLEVAVQHAARVRVMHRVRELAEHVERALRRERPAVVDAARRSIGPAAYSIER